MQSINRTSQPSNQDDCRIDPRTYANAREIAARARSIAVGAAFTAAFGRIGALMRRLAGTGVSQASGGYRSGGHGGQLRGA